MHGYESGGRPTGESYPEAAISLVYAPNDKTVRVSSMTRTPSAGAAQGIDDRRIGDLVSGGLPAVRDDRRCENQFHSLPVFMPG